MTVCCGFTGEWYGYLSVSATKSTKGGWITGLYVDWYGLYECFIGEWCTNYCCYTTGCSTWTTSCLRESCIEWVETFNGTCYGDTCYETCYERFYDTLYGYGDVTRVQPPES